MKKLIAIIVLTAILAAGLTYTTILYAAPGDVTITLVIPADKVADFSAGFLAKLPIPQIDDPENPGEMIKQYTPKEWITEWLRRQAVRAYRHGKIKLAADMAIADLNILPEQQ